MIENRFPAGRLPADPDRAREDLSAALGALYSTRLELADAQRDLEQARRQAAEIRVDRDRLWHLCEAIRAIAGPVYTRAVSEEAARRAGKMSVHRRFPRR